MVDGALLEETVDASVGLDFVDTSNRRRQVGDPPARFVLDGPFVDGARGTTFTGRSVDLVGSRRDLERSFTIEMIWTRPSSFQAFAAASERTTDLQRILLAVARPVLSRFRTASARTSPPVWRRSPRKWSPPRGRPTKNKTEAPDAPVHFGGPCSPRAPHARSLAIAADGDEDARRRSRS